MNILTVMCAVVSHGWKIEISDGRELARCAGVDAKRRALQRLAALGLEGGTSDGR